MLLDNIGQPCRCMVKANHSLNRGFFGSVHFDSAHIAASRAVGLTPPLRVADGWDIIACNRAIFLRAPSSSFMRSPAVWTVRVSSNAALGTDFNLTEGRIGVVFGRSKHHFHRWHPKVSKPFYHSVGWSCSAGRSVFFARRVLGSGLSSSGSGISALNSGGCCTSRAFESFSFCRKHEATSSEVNLNTGGTSFSFTVHFWPLCSKTPLYNRTAMIFGFPDSKQITLKVACWNSNRSPMPVSSSPN